MKKFAVTALLFAVPVVAQNCPVEIKKAEWNIQAMIHTARSGGEDIGDQTYKPLVLHEQNVSGKQIEGTRVAGEATNVMGEKFVPTLAPATSTDTVKIGKDKKQSVLVSPIRPKTHVRVWVDEVRFSDGSNWKDDGTHACATDIAWK